MEFVGIPLTIFGLLALNAWQFWFWSRETQKLIDKLMSRNYADYAQSSKLKTELPQSIVLPREDQVSEQDVLNEVNRNFGT